MLRIDRRTTLAAGIAITALCLAPAARAQVNETPGIGKKNHTVYVFAPYKWEFKRFDVDGLVGKHVADADKDFGQQYTLVTYAETKKPTDDAPAKTCTVEAFRDLLKKNRDDMGVLVISSHGSNESISVEPFASEKARDAKYDQYVKAGFGKDEIVKTSNEESWSISVTDKFVKKYRDLGNALVFISTCKGSTLTDDFTAADADVGKPARVALGGTTDAKFAAFAGYAALFFGDLDGQYRKNNLGKRLENRAVGAAAAAANAIGGAATIEAFKVEFKVAGDGKTTLSPIVTSDGMCGALKKDDTITFTFDTNCDTTKIPTVEAVGLTLGAPAWKGGAKNVLEVPVTGPPAATDTYKVTLKGNTVKAAKNDSLLDGNQVSTPDKDNPRETNGRGLASTKTTTDDYVIELKAGKRQ